MLEKIEKGNVSARWVGKGQAGRDVCGSRSMALPEIRLLLQDYLPAPPGLVELVDVPVVHVEPPGRAR